MGGTVSTEELQKRVPRYHGQSRDEQIMDILFAETAEEVKNTAAALLTATGTVKFDQGKPDFSLLPLKALEEVVRVLEYGAKKYKRDNWKLGNFDLHRFEAAALRHLADHQDGQENDQESGLPHVAHAVCNYLFYLYHMYHKPTKENQ